MHSGKPTGSKPVLATAAPAPKASTSAVKDTRKVVFAAPAPIAAAPPKVASAFASKTSAPVSSAAVPKAPVTAAAGGAGHADDSDTHSVASSLVAASAFSEVHVMGRASGHQSHPTPMLDFISVEEMDSGVITIRMPSDRPPTQLKAQGRHISAYALMVEVVLAKIEGQTFDAGIEQIDRMLAEYIADKKILAAYAKTVEEAKEVAAPEMLRREERVKIEMAFKAAMRFFKSTTVATVIGGLDATSATNRYVKDAYDKDKAAVLDASGIDPGHIRDLLKRAGEFMPGSAIIKVAVANALKLLNKMDEVAFAATKTEAAKGEGSLISSAIEGLRKITVLPDGKVYSSEYIEVIGKWIADLFDYPQSEFVANIVLDKEKAVDTCIDVIRRHIKLVYDAFPNIRPAFHRESEFKRIIQFLLTKVIKDFEWRRVDDDAKTFKDEAALFAVVKKGLIISPAGCLFKDDVKFGAAKPKYPKAATEHADHVEAARGVAASFGRLSFGGASTSSLARSGSAVGRAPGSTVKPG